MEETVAHKVPNLDCMPADELMDFWKKFQRPSRKDAEELVGDRRRGYTTIAGKLAGYASNKATAVRCRQKGKIASAESYEAICDCIYKEIPEDLRW